MMKSDKICKTVHQYNKKPIPYEDMKKLMEIADGYNKVKNYVYQRYGGVKSLPKLYPGYTIQNEMTKSGLRAELDLPSVYFYLAVFDALGDIKTQWTKTKTAVLAAVGNHTGLSEAHKHYLRFVLKVSSIFDNILNGKEIVIPEVMQEQYEKVVEDIAIANSADQANAVDIDHLNKYLCRQVRKRLHKLHTDKANGFAIAERAYRYGDDGKEYGIFLSTKEKRKRVFVPLTDPNTYKSQLYIKLKPEKSSIEISIAIEAKVHRHADYRNAVGISLGMQQMLTTDSGSIYGERFGEYQSELTEFISKGNAAYRKEKSHNPGRQKYNGRKQRLSSKLHTYINQEINRMLKAEKPEILFIPKFPKSPSRGVNGKINYSATLWQRGYIKNRLSQKCRANGIELVEVFGLAISRECSRCGAEGSYEKERFYCPTCGYQSDKKQNAACNAKKRGEASRQFAEISLAEENS